jgi:serine O-acetyltransferase
MATFEERIEGIVDTIMDDYQGGRYIDKMESFRRPDRDVVVDIIEKLRRILFPGYIREKNYRMYNAKHNLSMLIEDVMFNLNRQIALVYQTLGEEPKSAQSHAQQVCLDFFALFLKLFLPY